jgi:hypothetical protein
VALPLVWLAGLAPAGLILRASVRQSATMITVLQMGPARRLPEFALGIVLGVLYTRGAFPPVTARLAGPALLLIAIAVQPQAQLAPELTMGGLYDPLFLLLLAALAVGL